MLFTFIAYIYIISYPISPCYRAV